MKFSIVAASLVALLLAGGCQTQEPKKAAPFKTVEPAPLTTEQVNQYVEDLPALSEYLAGQRKGNWDWLRFGTAEEQDEEPRFEEEIDRQIEKASPAFRRLVTKLGYEDLNTFARIHDLVWQAYTCGAVVRSQRQVTEDIQGGNVRQIDDRGHRMSQREIALAKRHAAATHESIPQIIRHNAEIVAPFAPLLKMAGELREE